MSSDGFLLGQPVIDAVMALSDEKQDMLKKCSGPGWTWNGQGFFEPPVLRDEPDETESYWLPCNPNEIIRLSSKCWGADSWIIEDGKPILMRNLLESGKYSEGVQCWPQNVKMNDHLAALLLLMAIGG